MLWTIDAISMGPLIYVLKEYFLSSFAKKNLLICGIVFVITVGITALCLFVSRKLPVDEFPQGAAKEFSLIDASELPTFLGYFFVSLSIPEGQYLLAGVIFFLLFLFVYRAQIFCYNPLLLLLGFHFYQVTIENGFQLLLITKQRNIRRAEGIWFEKLYRLNDYSYLDL